MADTQPKLQPALGIADHLRRSSATADSSCGEFARFKSATGRTRCGELCAHLLEARGKRFNLLLLLSRTRFHCLNFAMLFEKLVEQHCVHLLVTNAVGFSFLVAYYEGGIHL